MNNISDFLKTATILIVSSKTTHRTGVKKLLNDNGADYQKIEVASDFAQAKQRLEEQDIVHIIITDNDIGEDESVASLIPIFFSNNKSRHSRLMIMTAGEVGDAFKADFLASGGDLVIDKPFTTASFIDPFKKVLQQKCVLGHDEKMAINVEDALEENNMERALEYVKAMKNPKSSTAQYSKGIISMHDKDYEKAYDYFTKALEKEKKPRLRTLNNLVISGVQSKKYVELDKYVESWIKKYPLESKAVPDITRVVLYNKKFDLLDQMLVDDENAQIAIAAGLVISSAAILNSGDTKRSIDYALKGVEFSADKERVILKAMEVLILAGAKEEAEKIISDPALKEKLENYPKEYQDVLELMKNN